jgi:hypothetical protein
MNHIVAFVVMGMIAACIAGFWTRIIKLDMIFEFVWRWLNDKNHNYTILSGRGEPAPISRFLKCIFCLCPWVAFILDACYIILYHPAWYFCIIGVFASLGAGNFISETIYALRGQE